jgi:diacylglycerol kinase family enzyme
MTSGRTAALVASSGAEEASSRSRWLARLALLLAVAGIVLPLAAAGLRGSLGLMIAGLAGLAAAVAGVWWFLTNRGVVRVLAGALVVVAPIVLVVLFVRAGLLWVAVVDAALWAASGASARAAFSELVAAHAPEEHSTPPPRRPFLIMNPKSGGGKVGRFALVSKAQEMGAEVVLLDAPGIDVAELARKAVAEGADLLGVAGGDGTQALVAAVAAEHDVPFMVLSAGTRNHFALDLGLDRENPAAGLDALTDGVELLIDLGSINGRTFVNNASFGVYAAVVQSSAYRDDKIGTTLDMLPELLARQRGPVLRVQAGDLRVSGPHAVLVSNNPYGSDDLAGLGVLAVSVERTADAVALARGRRARAVLATTCPEVTIDSDAGEVPVGVDGEALVMAAPVRCSIRPGALRVRVPRNRPGARAPRPKPAWTELGQLALPARRAGGS